MSNSLLTLGPFSFEGLESPERIHLKARQRLAVHHLGSGMSTIDYLGDDYETISFRGIFSGPGAAGRIRSIDYLRVLGAPLILSWNSKTLSVIIRQFELDYSSERWIPYSLSCYVVRSVNAGTDDPTDVMSVSPSTQVSEVLGLLDGTGINPTSDQADALLTLATLNFDIPPPVAFSQARDLINLIDDRLRTINDRSQNYVWADEGYIREAADMAAFVIDYGQQIGLTFGRNRVMSVMACAEDVSQQ